MDRAFTQPNDIFCSSRRPSSSGGRISILWIVYQGFKLATGKEGMGFGDFKLLAALGAWFGWMALPGIVLISSAIGAIVGITLIVLGRPREEAIAFGPYLALAGFVYLLAGDTVYRFIFQPEHSSGGIHRCHRGIGSGKTLVTDAFAAKGVVIADADEAARHIVEPGQPALAQIVAHFGEGIIDSSGRLDRPSCERLYSMTWMRGAS